MNKTLLILAAVVAVASSVFAGESRNNTYPPDFGTQIGGVGSDGKFHFITVDPTTGGINTTATVTTSTAARTPGLTIVTASGNVAAGARRVTFAPSSDFAGSILGTTIAGTTNGSAFTFIAPMADTLSVIAYTRSAGSLTILEVR